MKMLCFSQCVYTLVEMLMYTVGLFKSTRPVKGLYFIMPYYNCVRLRLSLWISLTLSLQSSQFGKKRRESSPEKKKALMDPQLTEVSQQLERFKAAFVRKDYNTCSDLLSRLKVLLCTTLRNPTLIRWFPLCIFCS